MSIILIDTRGHFSPARSSVYACTRAHIGMGLEFKAVNGIIEIRSSSSTRTSSLFGFESGVRAFAFASLYTLYFVCIYVEHLTTTTHRAALLSLLLLSARSSSSVCAALECACMCVFSFFSLACDAIRPKSPNQNVIM
jgi:hypothetical protein